MAGSIFLVLLAIVALDFTRKKCNITMLICPFRSTSFITSWSFCGFTQAGLWHKVWSSTKEGTFEVATGFHSATTRR